ncbi:high choriolytic enzyme 1 [Aplysia californica]|uniref:Metalloendopeptidase n=1 Tax=Aplysia californica TaxID=6500 RepID=A0ABM1A336_APLCA|nr:high choriolytic enzyme 1 [Aplysia californica]
MRAEIFVASALLVLGLATSVRSQDTRPMDEMIIDAANSSLEFEFFYDPTNSTSGECFIKVELDIVYSCAEWQELLDRNNSVPGRRKRTAGINPGQRGGHRWTNNRIPYELRSGHFSSRDRQVIQSALSDWSRYTCLSFTETTRYRNRLRFQNGGGCFSRVGMVGGAQVVGLASGCRYKGVVIHEVGHAIGLHHEQTRPDRDQHVRIIRQNIPPRVYYNFEKYSWTVIKNMGIPYDYSSIMHYGKKAFTMNGGLTIQTVNPKYQNVIGNRHNLSFRDIKSVNIMYNCKAATRGCTKRDSSCPGEGFVGKDCKCWCPGSPYQLCTGGGGGGGGCGGGEGGGIGVGGGGD